MRTSDWPYWPCPAPPTPWEAVEAELKTETLAPPLRFLDRLWRHLWVPAVLHVQSAFALAFHDAEDAASDVFLELAESAQQGALPEPKVGWCAFVIAAARHRAIDLLRARRLERAARRHAATGADETPQRESTPDDASAREEAAIVGRALAVLPPRQRDVLRLWRQGFRHAEIAEGLQITLGASYVYLHRGLTGLERRFGVARRAA